jgi:nodulation protein E
MNRVVITGMGVASPVGTSLDEFWSALVEGRSGIGPLTLIPLARLKVHIAAQVKDFDPAEHFKDKLVGQLDRFSQFAMFAARAALRDAGLVMTEELALKTATVVGCGAGGQQTVEQGYEELFLRNSTRFHPLTIARWMVNAACSQISIDLGLKGPAWTVASACASGTHAIGQAFHLVRNGHAAAAFAGGAEAPLTVGSFKAWETMRVLSTDTCRPFSRTRSGLVLGEGAAMMLLETRECAVRRGAKIYAELLGFGMSADATDIIAANAAGASRAMTAAMEDAQLAPSNIDYINAHGTGTVLNDRTESQAIRMTFGSEAERLAISSSKAVLGHSLGASGALELAATALALRTSTIPPTANFQEPDPDCGLDFVPNSARSSRLRYAMSNSFAFGGLNAVIVLGRA